MKRFNAMLRACAGILVTALVAHADPVVRSPLQADTAYASLSPVDQLKKLAALSKGGQSPADMELLGAEAGYRYIQSESNGDAAGEMAAYQKLFALHKTDFAGARGTHPQMASRIAAWALLADTAFQSADAKTRLRMLHALEDKDVRCSLIDDLADWTIMEHVATRTAGLAVKDRGLAKLKALGELAATKPEEKTAVDESGVGRIWTWALAEHLAYHPGWETTPPEAQVEYLRKLFADVRMNRWGGTAELGTAATNALRADPAWAAASVEQRVQIAKTFSSKHGGMLSQYLESYAKGKLDPAGNKPPLEDLAAALGDTSDPAASLSKLRQLQAAHSLPRDQCSAISLRLAMRYVGGDGTKPITPIAENAKWITRSNNDQTAPLRALDTNELGTPEFLSLVAQVVLDPTYAKSNWSVRAKLVDKTNQGFDIFSSFFGKYRGMALQLAASEEAAKFPAAQRGMARVKALARFYSKDNNTNLQDSYLQHQIADALVEHFAANPAVGKARFTQLQSLLKQRVLVPQVAGEVLAQATLDMLQADPAFAKADDAGKRAKIEQLEKSQTIDFLTASRVKRALKL